MSIDNNIFGNFFLKFLIISSTLFHSTFCGIILDPGLVDSPPTSIMSAPELIMSCIFLRAFLGELNFPPSEKLSGVIFNIPIII